ncbi:MAG: hypothetical protein K2M65_01735, partial [Muribaculaceae bacterium]|nr:hypothetical protein [Muribaculaceae bacterium]
MKKQSLLLSLACTLILSACSSGSEEPEQEPGTDPNKPSVTVPGEPADKTGMTVRGIVTGNGEPLAGVVVSDGVEVTQTDKDGIYYLPSSKSNGYVFISTPSGYEAPLEGNTPKFWKKTAESADKNEVINFSLTKVSQNKVALMAFADFHLANRNSDITQFTNLCNDANNTANRLKAEGYTVYGVSLGDESWDLYWYSNNYAFSSAYTEIERLKMPFYHNMGNHDNNPYYAEDRAAEKSFRSKAGPTFYSFNAGDAHIVILDDVQYKNVGGSIGTIGDRSYNAAFADDILDWLKKDLATITDKSKPL